MDGQQAHVQAHCITTLGKETRMIEATDLVRRYLEVWNESDAGVRRATIAAIWADDGCYLDPGTMVTGHDEISDLVGAVQERLPGHVFRLLNGVDAHHNVARFAWQLVPRDGGDSVAEGFDIAVIDADGRIGSILGFLDKTPAP
jgi:hypothetical protein